MAKMKIGTKSKNKQPSASYAVSIQMDAKPEPEVIEKVVEVEKIVEKEVRVEVPVRLGESETMAPKDCSICKSHQEMIDAKVKELEGVMAASGDEMQDLVESMGEAAKVQDRRIKELEIEVDREMSSQINDLQSEMEMLKVENAIIKNRIIGLEKAGWGMIVVSGLIMLMIMST